MIDIREMFDYSRAVRSKFATKLSELPQDQVNKNREATFYSMKNILLHIIDNEDWIVNYAIFEKTKEYKRRNWDEYTNMAMVLEHMREVESKTRKYLARIDASELGRRVVFELSSGRTFDLTVEECLFQSFTEQLYHMGELIALLWQENIEPPTMQWFYNNPRERKNT
jgi:uncharacterized damage-inducible protein DinB